MGERADDVVEVAVFGDDPEDVTAAVESAGGHPRTGDAAAALDPDGIDAAIAVGEPALVDAVRADPAVPILPVDAGAGVRSIPRGATGPAVESLLAGRATVTTYPVVAASVDGAERARALFDLLVATAEPARISAYAVAADGEPVAEVRADGIVAATPAGSSGYARSAGGPVVAPGSGVAVVVPVAPFETDPDHWVFPLESVELRVEHDGAAVELVADGRAAGTVPVGEWLALERAGTVALLAVEAGRSPYGLEKL